jgi:hypothetical protein
MATITNITTGEQSVTATGAVTGTLDTSALTGDYTVKLRVRGLLAGKKAIVAIEDTANATPYSDKVQVAVKHFVGGDEVASGTAAEWRSYDISSTRFGATNTGLRVNVLSITGSPTFSVFAWLEQ